MRLDICQNIHDIYAYTSFSCSSLISAKSERRDCANCSIKQIQAKLQEHNAVESSKFDDENKTACKFLGSI